jgi:hypothetical protein
MKFSKSRILNAGSPQRFTASWLLILLMAFLLQSLTISYLPSIGQDEVQITDYGRLSLYPSSNWSMTWMIGDEKPLLLWSYLGPLISEIAFHIGGPSGTSTRIASLIGGLVAASMTLGWLLSRRIPKFVAMGLSVAFLLDPLFLLSQRMGRSDSWVIAFCLASCWLLRGLSSQRRQNAGTQVFLAGGLTAIAAWIWPSAFLLYPLILLEFVELILLTEKRNRFSYIWRFLAGGMMVSIILLIPIWQNIQIIFGDMLDMMTLNVNATKSPLDKIAAIFSIQNWLKLAKIFIKTFSPFLPVLAIIGLVWGKQTSVKLAFLTALMVIFGTLIYEFRALYLLPYFLALGGSVFLASRSSWVGRTIPRISKAVLLTTAISAVVVSIFIRSGIALRERTQQDRNKLNYAAESYIGKGDFKVFLAFTYEFYYAGRALGWELYTPYIEYTYDSLGNWKRESDYKPKDRFMKLLGEMDYALFSRGTLTDELKQQLSQSGLKYSQVIFVNPNKEQNSDSTAGRTKRILLTFLFGYKDYGPYILYSRRAMNSLADKGRNSRAF